MITIKIDPKKKHKISPYLYMQFMEPLGVADSSVDAGWDFTENRWWPMLMDRVRELAPTMVRWGGSFASYYHWREAVGPRDRRVPMFNHCWGGIYHNQVGTHEVLDFCRQANAAPLLVVNMESEGLKFWQQPKNDTNRMGTAQEAADWVAYCNDPENPERLAITEGHFGLKGRNRCEVLSSWGAGVSYARCLNTIMRHSDVVDIATMADFFGNVWQVNAILISGVIREHDTRQKCYLQPVGAVMSLFRHHQGEYYLDCSYNGALDAVCSATENKVYIHAANTDINYAQELKLDLGGQQIKSVEMFYIAEDPATEITPLNQDAFDVKTKTIEGDTVPLPPAAVAAIEITLE